MRKRIIIASDHAAVDLKVILAEWLNGEGYAVEDLGTHSTDSVDYPDFGYRLADAIASGQADLGVALCGSGVGISIAVNRNPACRCALVSDKLTARLSRKYNDANVIAMGSSLIGVETAKDCLGTFLDTDFCLDTDLGDDRHQRRVDKLSHPICARESS